MSSEGAVADESIVVGRLILDKAVVPGRITIRDGVIASVVPDPAVVGPYIAPGFVDIHIHGWAGHDAMGDRAALDGMARGLIEHGVTSFLPTALSAPVATLARFADGVRSWSPHAPEDGAEPLGFNLEGPFLADARRGAHDPASLRDPVDVDRSALEPLLAALRVMTIAPERPGAIALIGWLRERGVRVSLGHSAATTAEARAGYDAGAISTTHLFNAMTGADHHAPGLAAAALADDRVYVELIADGEHVDRAIWPLVVRSKPTDRLLLVSDAIPINRHGDTLSMGDGRAVDLANGRVTIAGTATLAGSVIALDTAVRNLVESGVPLPDAVAAASRNPLALLGVTDRGRIAAGQRADLVELDDDLRVRRVMRAGVWH